MPGISRSSSGGQVSLYEKQPQDLLLQICNGVSDAINAYDKLQHQFWDASESSALG